MTRGFVLQLTGATSGIAAGAIALALGLAYQATGHSLFGIAGTAYAGVGATTWIAGIVLLIKAVRSNRSRPHAAVVQPLAAEANKARWSKRTAAALFLAAALALLAVFTLTDDPKFLAIGMMNFGLALLFGLSRK